jgi:hypothetical protein
MEKRKCDLLAEINFIYDLRKDENGILVYDNETGNYLEKNDGVLMDNYQDQHRHHSYDIEILKKNELVFLLSKINKYLNGIDHKKNDEFIPIHDATHMEIIKVRLDREHTPVAFAAKIKELMGVQAFETEDEAVRWLESEPIDLELYYEPGYGLFAAEADAVESGVVSSPYSGKRLDYISD